jgi:protein-S-isoprenylcysteine O-methyltransferase Ste14
VGVHLLLSEGFTIGWGPRAVDLALAASVASWGVRRWLDAPPGIRAQPATLAVCALHAVVAVLFVVRRPVEATPAPGDLARALPSVVLGALALALAARVPAWPLAAVVMVALGASVSIVSLAWLGRSFAVLPIAGGTRALVTRGPYALVRHPAYVGELLMIAGCVAAAWTATAVVVGVLAAAAFVVRVQAEERRLGESEAYRAYARVVRWRWVPGVW